MPNPYKNLTSKKPLLMGICFVAFLIISYLLYIYLVMPPKSFPDTFSTLSKQGYTLNVGLSSAFQPGTVIQTTDGQGPGGRERTLSSPLVFAWPTECFPGQVPKISEYTLPQESGHSSADLTIGAKQINKFLPSLNFDGQAVADYSLRLENARVLTFAKGDLSTCLSFKCVQSLKKAISSGEKAEWFSVILDAVTADSLTMEIEWKAASSVEARKGITEKAGKVLRNIATSGKKEDNPAGIKIEALKEDQKKTVLSAKGLVVIGYRARPIKPQIGAGI